MNILLLLDDKIRDDQLKKVKIDVAKIYDVSADVTIRWFEERRDYTTYPKQTYSAGYEGIAYSHIDTVTKEIYSRWAEEVDQVVFLIHADNWNLKGVWGWNISKTYSGYGVQQCRFDHRNLVNSIGVMYHELMHDANTFVYTYTGKIIETLFDFSNWDDAVVHGEHRDWSYIRHNENQSALVTISPLLRQALVARHALFTRRVNLLNEIIRLAEIVLTLTRAKIAADRADLPILEGNTCLKHNN